MGPFNRREFLQHSAAISAALATASQQSFLQAAPATSAEKPVGANETLRVAVIGVKGRGMSHVGGFNNVNGCEIVTICDCDEAVIGNAMKAVEGKRKKAPKFEKDLRKVMEDKDIDIVSIATPNHWHSLAAIWAMQAGKDVYVEKPVSHNVREGRIVVDTARKLKKICQSGTQSRSMPGMREAMAFMHAGDLGKVNLAYATCYKPRGSIGDAGRTKGEQPIPATIDYDLWCGPAPKTPLMRSRLHYDWHWIWNYGNGDLGNQGIHEMDKARWGLGKMELPKSVMSLGGRFGYVDDGETANTQICLFDYGDAELIFEVRGLKTGDYMGSKVGNIFFGSKGVIVCPSYAGGFLLDMDGKKVRDFKGDGGDGNHFGNFVKAVRSRKMEDLNGDILQGHLSSALCHLGNISYQLGAEKAMSEVKDFTQNKDAIEAFARMSQHLKDNNVDLSKAVGRVGPLLPIDPKTERFTGSNDKANAMLFREYRKGFEVIDKV
ncbi:MAG: Gfo/Idh/MocA family oxidoreductase [Planctomycetes bacterium]|nr:Gfo/Idh/MocA family oxidoreductase [Planctomycetota bacterium]